jgi:hypothetical protein
MKQIAAVLALVLCTACAGRTPAAVLSPTAGSVSASADAVIVTALSALQTSAVVLGPVFGLPAADTAEVVRIVALVIPIVQGAQSGWVTDVDNTFSALEAPGVLSPAAATTWDPLINAVQAAITAAYSMGPNGLT